MIVLEEHTAGLNAGLNRWRFKMPKIAVGSFIKRNAQSANRDAGKFIKENVNLKNAIMVGSLASSIIPGGGVASGLIAKTLGKLGAVGRLATKAVALANTEVGQMVMDKVKNGIALNNQDQQVVTQIAVAQDQDPTTPNVLTPAQFNAVTPPEVKQAPAPLVTPQMPTAQGTTADATNPAETGTPNDAQLQTIADAKGVNPNDLKQEVADQKDATGTPPAPADNTKKMLTYAGIGVAVLGIGYLATKNN